MSDDHGDYELSGCAKDFDWIVLDNKIDPFIFITHKCNEQKKEETVMLEVKTDDNNGYAITYNASHLELSNYL